MCFIIKRGKIGQKNQKNTLEISLRKFWPNLSFSMGGFPCKEERSEMDTNVYITQEDQEVFPKLGQFSTFNLNSSLTGSPQQLI